MNSADKRIEAITELLRMDSSTAEIAHETVVRGASELGVEHGHFTRILPNLDYWEVVASTDDTEGSVPVGATADLQTMYCRHAVEADETFLADTELEADSGWEFDWSCYITTPVKIDEELYGTLCFADKSSIAAPFDDSDQRFTECLAEVLEKQITLNERELTLANRNQLLSVLSRILRHNFRNDMTVVSGYIEKISDELEETTIESARLQSTIQRLISLTRKSRELSQIAHADLAVTEQSITSTIENTIKAIQQEHSDVAIQFSPEREVKLIAAPTIRTAIYELLENVAIHAGPEPDCEVTVEADTENVYLTVMDNGPGLPIQDRRILQGETETPLKHGQGVGLWIVRWVVNSHDGSIETVVSDTGTRITLTFPRLTAGRTLIES